MIRDAITEKEYYMMDRYISYNSNAQDHIPVRELLFIWSREKEMLYELLGNKLIFTKNIFYKRQSDEIEQLVYDTLLDEYANWRCHRRNSAVARYTNDEMSPIFSFMEKVNDLVEEKGRWVEKELPVTWINLFAADFIAKNIYDGESFKIPTDDSHYIYCERGAKLSKMLGKIARKFDIPGYEEFRIYTSQITNQNQLSGNLCISIHPLDYFTMSDNDCDWDSCMNWQNALNGDGGEYCRGTISMMNSPMVVVAYLKSEKDMLLECCDDDPAYAWSNKKWRQLFVVSQHTIASVRPYPYENSYLTQEVIDTLRHMAKEVYGWEYDAENKEYVKSYGWEGFDIHFTTSGRSMYCDFGYESKHHILINTNLGKHIYINYAGQDICLSCGRALWEHDFEDESKLVCKECYPYCRCCDCGDEYHKDEMYFDGENYYCRYCQERHFTQCSLCGDDYYKDEDDGEVTLVDNEDKEIGNTTSFYCCPHCMRLINDTPPSKWPAYIGQYFTGADKIHDQSSGHWYNIWVISIAGLTPNGLLDLCDYEEEDTE